MTTPQPQPSPQPEQGQPWTNPVDAPPPFPDAPTRPYANYGAYENQSHAPLTGPAGPTGRPKLSSDDRLWAIIAHLSAAIAWAVSAGWLNIVGPLVVYVLQKDKSPFVRNAAAGAFNFSLTMWITGIVGWILTITIVGAIVGIPLIIVSGLGSIILGIVGAVKSANDESYTYPLQLKVLS